MTSFQFISRLLLVVCLSAIYSSHFANSFSPQAVPSKRCNLNSFEAIRRGGNDFNSRSSTNKPTILRLAVQVSQKDAQKGIDKVVAALRKDKAAVLELGKLTKVNNVLGFGSPKPDTLAVRFNASFQKAGKGLSAVPLPFGMGQSNKSEGRVSCNECVF